MTVYDIVNISEGRWKNTVVLHLDAGPGKGVEHVALKAGDTLMDVPEDRVTLMVNKLAKLRRSRPAVLKLVEVDVEARQAKKDKAMALIEARAAKKMKLREVDPVELKPMKKKGKSKKKDELSTEEQAALEAGKPLPNEENK